MVELKALQEKVQQLEAEKAQAEKELKEARGPATSSARQVIYLPNGEKSRPI